MRAAKAWVAAIGTVVMALTAAFADDVFDANDAGMLVTVAIEAVLTVLAVYQVKNEGFVETGR